MPWNQTPVPARTKKALDRADFYDGELARQNRHLRVAVDFGADDRLHKTNDVVDHAGVPQIVMAGVVDEHLLGLGSDLIQSVA
ncbi:hypothetical protein CN934_16705 [Ensifer sp. MMN_5]|nr:hypothetical protein CN934_16705 [Ensifer sp. MMN_5]